MLWMDARADRKDRRLVSHKDIASKSCCNKTTKTSSTAELQNILALKRIWALFYEVLAENLACRMKLLYSESGTSHTHLSCGPSDPATTRGCIYCESDCNNAVSVMRFIVRRVGKRELDRLVEDRRRLGRNDTIRVGVIFGVEIGVVAQMAKRI